MQLQTAKHQRQRVGVAMTRKPALILLLLSVSLGCAVTRVQRAPNAGLIAAGPGGAAGYQHGIERSHFIVGAGRRSVTEFGFVKVVGSVGSFAVDAVNGAVIALPHARSAEQQKDVWYTLGSHKHDEQVVAYFTAAGIPRDQIGDVHATTSMYASGGERDSSAAQPKIAGWQSILQRVVVGGIPVIDSVAWARLNDEGKVITELVYWPPVPGKAIDDARRLRAKLSDESARAAFLAHLPRDLPSGNVVIRHSSITANGPFEVFASYDVVDHRTSVEYTSPSGSSRIVLAASVVRHFDIDGNERKLPQERRSPSGDFPTKKRQASRTRAAPALGGRP